jgi:hypothetical protein
MGFFNGVKILYIIPGSGKQGRTIGKGSEDLEKQVQV